MEANQHITPQLPVTGVLVKLRNLPPFMREEILVKSFKRYGIVLEARIHRDDAGNSTGFGYVRYQWDADVESAVNKLNGNSDTQINAYEISPKKKIVVFTVCKIIHST